MAREDWVAKASEILGTPVADAVPAPRRRAHAWLLDTFAAAVFAVVVLLDLFVLPGPTLLVPLFVLVSVVLTRLGIETRFAALTRDGILWMLTAPGWFPHPVAPIGSVEPAQVSGPTGLFRTRFVIAGATHHVALHHKKPFQRMVETARRASVEL